MYVQYKTTMATEHTSRALSHTVDLHTSTMDAGIAAYAAMAPSSFLSQKQAATLISGR